MCKEVYGALCPQINNSKLCILRQISRGKLKALTKLYRLKSVCTWNVLGLGAFNIVSYEMSLSCWTFRKHDREPLFGHGNTFDRGPTCENNGYVVFMDEGRERDKTSRGGGLPTLPGLYLSTIQPSQRGFFWVHMCVWRERKPEAEFLNFLGPQPSIPRNWFLKGTVL